MQTAPSIVVLASLYVLLGVGDVLYATATTGQRIAAGPPAVALREPHVIDVYLGPDFARSTGPDTEGEP